MITTDIAKKTPLARPTAAALVVGARVAGRIQAVLMTARPAQAARAATQQAPAAGSASPTPSPSGPVADGTPWG
jgi:hypothetical protein